MHPLLRLLEKNEKRVIGLMSGTSLDGIDCALCTIRGHGDDTELLDVVAETYPYEPAERERLLHLTTGAASSKSLASGSFWLGERLAAAVLRFLSERGLSPSAVDLIGSHGQTVWHQPPSMCATASDEVAATLQIGEPAVLAARTGVPTIADFRVADVALGGEGAPLVPYLDWLLFRKPGTRRALQNIGGIANATIVAERPTEVIAFDNGPGNLLLDALAPLASGGEHRYDIDGTLSARGAVLPDVLTALLDDDYLRRPPPKSTGRERYGPQFVAQLLARHPERAPRDLLRTAVAFTAHAIADSLRPFRLDELWVSGGGAHNRTLMATLSALLPGVAVSPLTTRGIDTDNKEAVAFAILAVQSLHGEVANLPSVTGARSGAILGKLCLPPPLAR